MKNPNNDLVGSKFYPDWLLKDKEYLANYEKWFDFVNKGDTTKIGIIKKEIDISTASIQYWGVYLNDCTKYDEINAPFEHYVDFEEALISKIRTFEVGDIKSLYEILGNHKRRLVDIAETFEGLLKHHIDQGYYHFLSLSTNPSPTTKSSNNPQYYKVEDTNPKLHT